jgi:hypothetical protein
MIYYYAWLDIDKRHTPAEKIAGAIAAYRARFGREPEVVLVNEADLCVVAGVDVQSTPRLCIGNVWVGPC